MNILTNEICDLEILSKAHLLFEDDNTPKNPNILSGVFFKRDQYYKNFGTYVKGLQRTVRFIDRYNREVDETLKIPESKREHTPEKFVFLIFIDKHIREDKHIMRIIESSKSAVPVLFRCSEYMDGEYHIDLFGTLVRFFPMFDFADNPSQNSTIITIDIELNREDMRKVHKLMKHRPEGVTASGEIHNLIYKGEVPYIYAGSLCFNREKLSKDLIVKFIKSAHTITGTGHYGKRKTTFGYGIDEIFLNSHLIPAVKYYSNIIEYQISYFLYHSQKTIRKQKRADITHEILKMILYNLYSPNLTTDDMLGVIRQAQFIYDIKRMIRRQTNDVTEISEVSGKEAEGVEVETETETDEPIQDEELTTMSKILQTLLGDMYDPSKSVEELLTLVDKKTYNVMEKNEVNNALAERFYFIIHNLVKSNKTWMEMDVMKLINDNLRNVISSYVIFKIDPDNKEITEVNLLDPVYTDNVL